MTGNISFSDDKMLLSKINDMIKLSAKRTMVFSMFLNERECVTAEGELKRLINNNYRFYGIFENAERKMLCVYKEFFKPEYDDFPLFCITFTFRRESKLTHRDFLGAIMSLGIKREAIGDIVIDDGIAQVAATNSVKDLIISGVKKIGSFGIKYHENFSGILTKVQNFKKIDGTVASMRLDAVAGLALNLSRSKASGIIKTVGAEVNFILKNDCSYILKEGDVFSIRKFGKFKVSEESGVTKKGRIHISVLKYC